MGKIKNRIKNSPYFQLPHHFYNNSQLVLTHKKKARLKRKKQLHFSVTA